MVTDVLMVVTASVVAYLAASQLHELQVERYLPMLLVALLFPPAFVGAGLYRGPSFAEELRAVCFRTSMIWAGLMALTFIVHDLPLAEQLPFSRWVFGFAWASSIVLLLIARLTLRILFADASWWGSGALVIGTEPAAEEVIRRLQAHPSRGVKPVAVLIAGGDDDTTIEAVRGVPVLGTSRELAEIGAALGIERAILTTKGMEAHTQSVLTDRVSRMFARLAVIPDLHGFSHLWCDARDYGGLLGLDVKPALFRPWPKFCKRFWDIALATTGMALLAPVFLAIAVAIKLTSPGPVFYSQRRLGLNGEFFRMWKFRSMVMDADRRLQEHLETHPEARTEWESMQKLADDPRVTSVGKLLRISSLDELPQLWNVLNGTMSLVGPRPVPDDGVDKLYSYGPRYVEYYTSVRPGMSGLWQVEGRSAVSYDTRVELDMTYIRTWNVWLDWEILVKTARAVFSGTGAC